MKDLMYWDAVKCTECKSFNPCRQVSAMKGSTFCQVKKGYIQPREQRFSNSSLNFFGFISGLASHLSPKQLFQKRKQEEEEEQEEK